MSEPFLETVAFAWPGIFEEFERWLDSQDFVLSPKIELDEGDNFRVLMFKPGGWREQMFREYEAGVDHV